MSVAFSAAALEAEPIWDSIFSAAGNLDLSVGGPSFDVQPPIGKRALRSSAGPTDTRSNRRGAYMVRGYATNRR